MTRIKSFIKAGYCLAAFALFLSTPAISAAATAVAPTIGERQTLALPTAASNNQKLALAQDNFHVADVDRNEQLNLAEFKTFINLNANHNLGQAPRIRRFEMYAKAFKKADVNGDGVLTKDEIGAKAQE